MYSSMYDACGIFGQMRQWQWNIIRIGAEEAEVVQPPSYGCTVPMGGGCWGGGVQGRESAEDVKCGSG